MRTRVLWVAVLWFPVAVICLASGAFAAGAAGGCRTANLATPATCSRIGSLPGPEDFELQVTGAAAPRLLISSQARGACEFARGGLFEVPLAAGAGAVPVPLHLTGRGACSFHPHGISMVTAESGEILLYVINHHEAEDTAGCLKDELPFTYTRWGKAIHSVEVFNSKDGSTWDLQDRLLDPDVLTKPNDLTALPNGMLFVTNTPGSQLGFLYEGLIGPATSSVAMFDGTKWYRIADRLRIANGIAVDWERKRLYVAATGKKAIHVFALDGPGGVRAPRRLSRIAVGSGVDNLLWDPEGPVGRTLWVAAHPSSFAFLRLGIAWKRGRSCKPLSPSEVYRITLDGEGGGSQLFFSDPGQRISAASTAVSYGGELFVGQVFGDFMLRCRRRQ